MGRRSKLLMLAASVAVVVTMGACSARPPGAASTASQPAPSTAIQGTAPVATPEPTQPDLTYTCGGHPFSPTLFNEPEVDLRTHRLGAVVIDLIRARDDLGERGILPLTRWRVAGEDETSASFVAKVSEDPPIRYANLEIVGGDWQVVGWGECRPKFALRGAGGASWVLPEDEAVDRSSTTFSALVTEDSCTGGSSSERRVREPLIFYEPDRVVVIFTVDPLPPGTYECPGNPSTAVTVELSEPLGDRQLLDGGTFPFEDQTRNPGER